MYCYRDRQYCPHLADTDSKKCLGLTVLSSNLCCMIFVLFS